MLDPKRSQSEATDPPADSHIPPSSNSPLHRQPRRISPLTRLTSSLTGRPRRPTISVPIQSARSPVVAPSPTFDIGSIPPQRILPPWLISPRRSRSNSDPTNNVSPSKSRPHLQDCQPPLTRTSSFHSSFEYEGIVEDLQREFGVEHLDEMESARLQPPAPAGTKARAIQQAKEMEELVAERAKRSGDEPPPYDFYELIGKGAYGRVFKGKNRNTNGLVAIKIIDIDKSDYEEMGNNMAETLKEINILQQLRDSKARPFVNIIEEARPVHNELWIISEYASGGSVNTLMKPTMGNSNPGLDEKFIIPIARELALGLKYIHEAGVLHRDLKCNNILVLEDGSVQLCDFGVSGTLEPAIAKRSTIVGTPYWMAPELQKEWVKDADPHSRVQPNEILYGSEVDIWAYGCTVYEMASGFPPFHRTVQWDLPNSGVPVLEGERFSKELKDFVSFVLQPDPQNRPTADLILEHPFLANTTKMYPTVTLVKLVETYYMWEQSGGARASLFNPYGAQAPDPLAPEPEDDEDDDWTFSTSEEFEQEHAVQFADPFSSGPGQPFTGMAMPPADMGRFEQLQAQIKEESITRGEKRLNRLFDQNSTPYRYSAIDDGSGRPPSDLVLRDFNPGAPNRETVIDLDFAAPSTSDMPSIDLGEVPTLKANRMQRLLREMEMEEEERDSFDQEDQLTRRATRDWKFPTMNEQPNNRKTMEWKFPAGPEKPNRRTVEWTFDAAMAEANYDPPKNRMSRRPPTQEFSFPMQPAPPEDNRRTRDFVFPMRDPGEPQGDANLASSPTFDSGFRSSSMRRAAAQQLESFDEYPQVDSSPSSPLRTSMIDLDMATIDDYRPSTSDSSSTFTGRTEQMNDNPFNLEDQVHLSENNNRLSYHTKSQSEPNHAIPGLLTPQQYDEQGQPVNQDPHHPSMHARGVSSASQMQAPTRPQPVNIGAGPGVSRGNQRTQQSLWDGWSHSAAFGLSSDESPPLSGATDNSMEDEDIDELWDNFERMTMQSQRRQYNGLLRPRRTDSRDEDLRSEGEDNYPYLDNSYDDAPRQPRVSVGPLGKPLVDFPIPRGPDPEALLGINTDPRILQDAMLRTSIEMRDGIRASRDLLRAMRLEELPVEGQENDQDTDTVSSTTVRAGK